MASSRRECDREDEVVYRFIKSIGKGILKVMSKMGISTYQSYCGAQIFDAVGLVRVRRQVLHRHRDHDRGRRPGRDRAGDGARHIGRLRRQDPVLRSTRSISAANMPSACAAKAHAWSPGRGRDAAARRARKTVVGDAHREYSPSW
jgi:hypothetical protein